MSDVLFSDLGIDSTLVQHLAKMGFSTPTDIQQAAIPELLKQNRDFIGMASTGTGKTAAFAIPLIEKIQEGAKKPQALILCPTRELAQQVAGQIEKMAQCRSLRVALIYGGASYQTQIRSLKKGASLVVATPGRLIDLVDQGLVQLQEIRYLVLDEADEMLSLGFQEALDVILQKMRNSHDEQDRRIWLFSATMSSEIQRISSKYLQDPIIVRQTSGRQVADKVEQTYILVQSQDKMEVLKRVLMKHNNFHGLIFCQTRDEVDDLAHRLNKMGLRAEALHGDKSQREREQTLGHFRQRQLQVVVATDVAARGIDVKELSHVINWSLPRDVETYIHRIGRTGRNGQSGNALSLVDPSQMFQLRRIEKTTRQVIQKTIPPSVNEIQKEALQSLYARFEKIITNERLMSRVTSYSQELDLPDWFEALDHKTLLTLFASTYFPDFFRHTTIQEPSAKEQRERRPGRARFRRR